MKGGCSSPWTCCLRAVWLVWALSLPNLAAARPPVIAVVIDDMGNHLVHGQAAIALPGKLTYAFLPHTPYAITLAEAAHQRGKEVMLHLPMDAHDGTDLGPGALKLHMTETDFKSTFRNGLASVPYVAGVNNHMGSLLTRHPGAMAWLMEVLQERPDLYFIDSRTTHETVAQEQAEAFRVPNTRRDVFLDNDKAPVSINRQFQRLIDKALEQGFAVGIGHPYPETIRVLEYALAHLESLGVDLVSASELIHLQRSSEIWQEPSSPSQQVVKNSKQ